MKRLLMLVMAVACLGLTVLAGCDKGTKVHTEEERTEKTTTPVVTPDK